MWILNEESKLPLYIQLYQQIKADIDCGIIKTGGQLPSSRKLSAELGLSRNTIELAYSHLCADGCLASRPRQGYFVEAVLDARDGQREDLKPKDESARNIIYDFKNKRLGQADFPFHTWKILLNRCLYEHQSGLLQSGCPFGEMGLRRKIQKYLYRHRQVYCDVEQIVVGTGTQFCLELICQIIKMDGTAANFQIAMENPGHAKTRLTFQNNEFRILPTELDRQGINIKRLSTNTPDVVYVTPSHQCPTGIVMSIERRRQLAEWAIMHQTLIIEDDCNCHFQYNTNPLPSIQSMCSERVVYLGDFSDVLFPSVGVSYMVLPKHMKSKLCERYCSEASFVPFLTQKTLELFMSDGHIEKHIRKIVRRQQKKRDLLVFALKSEFGNNLYVSGETAGLHLLVRANWATTEEELVWLAYN
ncbi:MAG: PLP-dependent aminotransferase family protein, partial [Clostridiales bacterium]|nr:PLP-dependent aminotransferase family protein [Clostridiales bacterium]